MYGASKQATEDRPTMSSDGAQPATPSIFVCGFVERRLHNHALQAIVHDLLPAYFVSINPPSSGAWRPPAVRAAIAKADVCIFLMNEFTLKDHRCLLTIQWAWELIVPILVLRHPRMKLIVQPTTPILPAVKRADEPNMQLLQDIMFQGYKQSLVYDRVHHEHSMRHVRARLHKLFRHMAIPGNALGGNSKGLKLPPILSPSVSPTDEKRLKVRSRREQRVSTSNTSLTPTASPRPTKTKRATRTPSQEAPSATTSALSSGELPSAFRSLSSLDDEQLYHETQYLVFPVRRGRASSPTLIRFPSDVLGRDDELHLEAVYGSDSDLDEEVQIADEVKGRVMDTSPPPTPAPFMDDL